MSVSRGDHRDPRHGGEPSADVPSEQTRRLIASSTTSSTTHRSCAGRSHDRGGAAAGGAGGVEVVIVAVLGLLAGGAAVVWLAGNIARTTARYAGIPLQKSGPRNCQHRVGVHATWRLPTSRSRLDGDRVCTADAPMRRSLATCASVNGHRFLPSGGHRFSPLIGLPGLWVDASGDVYHEACHSPTHRASGACAAVARFLARRGVAAGTPEVVWVKTLPASVV